MDEALFEDLAVFMGRCDQVSIDLTQLGGVRTFDLLRERQLIDPDPEQEVDEPIDGSLRRYPRFAQLRAASPEELRERLSGVPISSGLADALTRLYLEGARPMFALDRPSNLRMVEIPSGQVQLIDVDMRPCRLLGTRLNRPTLSSIVKSLEVSTFIDQSQRSGDQPLALRLIAGVQRVLVSSQAWLLLLALKRLSPWAK